MTRQPGWLVFAAFAAIVVLAFGQHGAAGAFLAALMCAACAVPVMAYTSKKGTLPPQHSGGRFVVLFLTGSILVGALYFLIVTAISPRPGPLNLLWMLGPPLVVGLLFQPRLVGLALSLPLAVTGWLWFAVAAFSFQIPLD